MTPLSAQAAQEGGRQMEERDERFTSACNARSFAVMMEQQLTLAIAGEPSLRSYHAERAIELFEEVAARIAQLRGTLASERLAKLEPITTPVRKVNLAAFGEEAA